MKLGINGKTAFVAGASGGIGRAVAEALAAEGCGVVLCARNETTLAAVRDDLHARHHVPVHYVAADLDDRDATERCIARVLGHFGGIDILVTNNGGPPAGGFDDLDEDAFERGWNRTLMSAVRLARGFIPGMKAQGFGRIIGITSISVKQPIDRLLLSNAYRSAVTGFLKTLSTELAPHGITVNAIAPGYIATNRLLELQQGRAALRGRSMEEEMAALVNLIPMGRVGRPGEIGSLAAFIASEQAAYMTGTTILVDGGMYKGLM